MSAANTQKQDLKRKPKHTAGLVLVEVVHHQGMFELRIPGKLIGEIREQLDALHIAECVRACDGINPEAVPEMLATLRFYSDKDNGFDWGERARAAIAKDVTPTATSQSFVRSTNN